MSEQIELAAVLPVEPERIYKAWMDEDAHTLFTGENAVINPIEGGRYSAWDGYIRGRTLTLEPFRRILQSWRTSDFPTDAPDSMLEVLIEGRAGESVLTLRHSEIPYGQANQYEECWRNFYLQPLLVYFLS
jgi:activator of HSP90 ATPase